MKFKCDNCREQLTKPGALAFSPPHKGRCRKYHLCVRCWGLFEQYLQPPPTKADPKTSPNDYFWFLDGEEHHTEAEEITGSIVRAFLVPECSHYQLYLVNLACPTDDRIILDSEVFSLKAGPLAFTSSPAGIMGG